MKRSIETLSSTIKPRLSFKFDWILLDFMPLNVNLKWYDFKKRYVFMWIIFIHSIFLNLVQILWRSVELFCCRRFVLVIKYTWLDTETHPIIFTVQFILMFKILDFTQCTFKGTCWKCTWNYFNRNKYLYFYKVLFCWQWKNVFIIDSMPSLCWKVLL